MKPRIRLKGFEGEWKLTSFGRNVKLRRGLTYSPTDVCSNGIRVLRSSNIDEDTFVVSKDDVFVNDKCVNIPFANQGDILITAANGSPRLVGKHCLIKTDDMNMVHGGFMLLASSPESAFYNASMGSGWYTSFKRIGISGGNGAIGNLDKTELENFKLYIPNSRCERDGLANYFKSLDALIQSTTQKVASLKQLKEASLISMFPQGDETTPRVRFKGFEGEWECFSLGKIATFSKGSGYSKSDLGDKGCPIILYGRLYTNYSSIIYEVDTFAIPKPNSVFSEGGEVIIPGSGETPEDISIAAAVMKKGILLGGDLNILHFDNSKFDSHFMAITISETNVHKELSSFAQGKSIVHLHNKEIGKGHIMVPNLSEQQRIASYFQNLDTQITLQEQRLEKLKQLKSACLDQMFV